MRFIITTVLLVSALITAIGGGIGLHIVQGHAVITPISGYMAAAMVVVGLITVATCIKLASSGKY